MLHRSVYRRPGLTWIYLLPILFGRVTAACGNRRRGVADHAGIPMNSSRVGIFDTADRAADIVGSAPHAARSTDHFVADTVNTAATANIADTEYPNTDRSKDHMTAREERG